MKRFRFDTLFLRLFVLMWVVLVLSHLVAFWVVIPSAPDRGGWLSSLDIQRMPVIPSLPPGGPMASVPPPMPQAPPGWSDERPGDVPDRAPAPDANDPGSPGIGGPAMPARSLWMDYGLRVLLIGLGAFLGAHWLSAPMRQLARAASAVPQRMAEGRAPAALDEQRGTVEVRETARVFNRMTRQLQEQFDQRSLHMAAMSHDLRTPLTRLRLRIEQMPDAQAQAASADVREMDALIDASLAVMREQANAGPPVRVDLVALLQARVDDGVEQGQPITLGPLPSSVLEVPAHPASLRRILDNLVSNGLRYGGQVNLVLERSDDEPAWLWVHVDDQGPGIAPDQLERVFRPWVRLPGERIPTGHGLGLSIARDLAERGGGSLVLNNRAEGGLRASLRWPLG